MTSTRKLPVFGLDRFSDRERAELLGFLQREALRAVDRLHGAIFELEDLRALGQEHAELCEEVFNRAQELCGHEVFRR